MHRLLSTSLALLLVLSACDTQDGLITPQDTTPDPDPLPEVKRSAQGKLAFRSFRLTLNTLGAVKSVGNFPRGAPYAPSHLYALSAGGLWIGADQNGASRLNLVRYVSFPYTEPYTLETDSHSKSSYGPCEQDSQRGVYHVFADTTYSSDEWPAEHGAPVNPDGSPKAYGTEMLWASMCSKATPPSNGYDNFSSPIEGLRVNAAVFVHERQDAVFVRYDIRNEDSSPIENAIAGFWADPDWGGTYLNLVGFDAETSMSYIYLAETDRSEDRLRTDRERGRLLGLVPLDTPQGQGITAHRYMTRHVLATDPRSDYGSGLEANRNALRGLFNDGTPQSSYYQETRPLAESPFAFSGNPLTGEGWLDGYLGDSDQILDGDARQLISSGTFDLQPGASATFTVAYITESRDSLADGLAALKQKAAQIQSQPSLWRFPIES